MLDNDKINSSENFVSGNLDIEVSYSYLEQWIVGQILKCELSLTSVTWICLPENCVSVTGYYLPRFEGLPNEVFDLFFSSFVAQRLINLLQPHQYLKKVITV